MNQTGLSPQEVRSVLQKMMKRGYITYYTIGDFRGQGLLNLEIKNVNEVLNRLNVQRTQTEIFTILRYDKI